MDQLANFVAYSPLAQPTRGGAPSSPDSRGLHQRSALKSNTMPRLLSRRLNPMFCERLMGWPLDWTSTHALSASSASATALWRSALQRHLYCLLGD